MDRPARSGLPLPEGLRNGDIVWSPEDNLLWFIWDNAKSRIWFPATLTSDELDGFQDAPPLTHGLVGIAQPTAESGHLAITVSEDGSELVRVYWLNTGENVKHPIAIKRVTPAALRVVTTATDMQYFPVHR